jgi:hypothetical protein
MGKLLIDHSMLTFFRRPLTPADSLITNSGENPFPALDTKRINVDEAEWVTLDASGKAVKLGAAPAAAALLAFPVWVGDRRDAAAALSIAVVHGPHNAKTSLFDTTVGAYAPGQRLTPKLIAGKSKLTKSVSGDGVVAIAEGPAAGATTDFPDGFLPYTTVNAGGVVA